MKKKNQSLKVICAILMIVGAVIGQFGNMTVKAANTLETNQGIIHFQEGEASIAIRGNQGQSLVGKHIILHKLFEAENAAGGESINYTLNETYAEVLKTVVGEKIRKSAEDVTEYEIIDYMQSLNNYITEGADAEQTLESSYSDYRYFMEDVLAEIHDRHISSVEIIVTNTKKDNSIEIKGLAYGYYMAEDVTEAAGEYMSVSLSMLTTANPEAYVNVKADYPMVSKKIQEDDNRDSIGEDGWNDIGDYEIGQDIPYRYQSNIPNINGYHTYYYTWHDVMDEALTLQEDSIQIVISGTLGTEEKIYQLSANEYQLIKNKENETFQIEIKDIKAIVDREFDQFNERKENIYGQVVTLTYIAALNDKAAEKTGRPGFENSVRLEFSNNPNSTGEGETGFTPWDTVVCFTYKLNGIKVNNYGTKLEGAVFRLYYDEACTDEVYLKQISDGYCVMHEDSWAGNRPTGATSMTSDVNGVFNIYGLDGGTYYLKEESAPDGYRQILEPIAIQITPILPEERNSYVSGEGSEDGILQLSAEARIITFIDGEQKEEDVLLGTNAENGSLNLSVVNEIGKKLPVTGSYLMPVFIGTGILFMGIALRKERKKNA